MIENLSQQELGYSKNSELIGKEAERALKNAIMKNNAVGSITGHYDEDLTILTVSEIMLENLGYTFDEFKKFTKGSLKNLFYGENRNFLKNDRFANIHGTGEGEMLTKDGTPVTVRMYKEDSVDMEGKPLWVLSVRLNWEHENITLINEALKSGFWYMDCDGNGRITKVHWSHAFRKMLGFQDTLDFPNKISSWSDLLHPEDHDKTLNLLLDVIADKSDSLKYDIDYRIRMKDGSYQWFRATASTVRRTDGSARRITGIFINIDEKKKSEMREKKAAAFHSAFTESNICEYYVDLKNDSFESLKTEKSRRFFDEKNGSWKELVEKFASSYVCEEQRKEVKDFYDSDTIVERLSDTDGELSLECKVIFNGGERWIRNEILRGEKNGDRYVLVFVRDITAARETAEIHRQMSKENESMGLLIKSVTKLVDHFAVCDLKNDSYEYYMIKIKSEYPSKGKFSNLIKLVAENLKMPNPSESIEYNLSPANIREKIRDNNELYKFDYCSKDESVHRSATFIPLKWENGVLVQVLWVSMDITKNKIKEIEARRALTDACQAAERANRAKTEFLTNMSHDIRTPMNAVVGLTAIAVANINRKEKVLDCLENITKSSQHLLRLINEVLDMARIESGKLTVEEELFNLPDLIDNLVILAKPGIDEHKHRFEISVKNIRHEDVFGDVFRLQQVFVNLLGNAIKYTPDGGRILFTIEEKDCDSQGFGYYEFVVQDNGIGMDEEFQKIIFQPFTRADDKRTTKVLGTGLGMAITQNILNMMNGNIRVESKLNQGTKVTVTLQLPLHDKSEDEMKYLENLPVLVVDDDIFTCKSTAVTLQEMGVAAEWVTSGKDAVEKVLARHQKNDDYFMVIVDWQMPEMDGIETARRIRNIAGENVAIIIMTAYDYSEVEGEARTAGADDFITKPLFRSRLNALFRNILENKPLDLEKDYIREMGKADFSDAKVLLVEDNDLNCMVASEIIGMTKAKIDIAKNGHEAVEKVLAAKDDEYDVVFMDIQMPVMNGYEATAAIRALPDKCSEVPIVAMTANAFAEDVQLAKNTGMNDHMAKPLDVEKLYKIMRKYCGPKKKNKPE